MANRVHYPSLASFEDVEIAAACDIDEVRLRETAERWGIGRTFADYREMVQFVQPDAVYAIGQPHLMYDISGVVPEPGLQSLHRKADGSHAPPGTHAG